MPALRSVSRGDPLLTPLFMPIAQLRGIGPNFATLIGKALRHASATVPEAPRLIDLLWHLPTGVITREPIDTMVEVEDGTDIIVELTVKKHNPPPYRGRGIPYRVSCICGVEPIILVFFRADADYLRDRLPIGATRYVCGRLGRYGRRRQMTHPDHILTPEQNRDFVVAEPIHPLTAGLSLRVVRRCVNQALEQLPVLPEWLDPEFMAARGWDDFRTAMTRLHNPQSAADLAVDHPLRQRPAYDELLAGQLILHLLRSRLRSLTGRAVHGDGRLRRQLIADLPFEMTPSQKIAIDEIEADLGADQPMLRLLQGDVGSGKTIVALAAMLIAAEAGRQAALMAPTAILARQHYATLTALCAPLGVDVALLIGGEKRAPRAEILTRIHSGSAGLIVGTHALFQDDVRFADLQLTIIDEQHRFGVDQRWALTSKGRRYAADLLVMSATPIPRTLMLTAYGDIGVSRLREKPSGRRAIRTGIASLDRLEILLHRLEKALKEGAQAYWICPLVADSALIDATAAIARYESLQARFGDQSGLVHGRMKQDDREAAMQRFKSGTTRLLVATTVIEVGVDVPEATVMVIEHAERFGLAQLHQLRGRVGRSDRESSCVLLYQGPLSDVARRRLEVLRKTDDGFVIAEEDFRLRGAGEMLGLRQSGTPILHIADPIYHADLLAVADAEARRILDSDPLLRSERGQRLRLLLQLFEREAVLHTLQAP